MNPKIALIGSPNVGKSSLFNILTNKKSMLVYKKSGTTRDRNFGKFYFKNKKFFLIDTAGIELSFFKKKKKKNNLLNQINLQIIKTIKEANLIIFMISSILPISSLNFLILNKIKREKKKIFLCINKIDKIKNFFIEKDFYQLGIKKIYAISLSHRLGLSIFLKDIFEYFYSNKKKINIINSDSQKNNFYFLQKKNILKIKICIIGKSNVGKSTLINTLINKKTLITSSSFGTTRDIITVPFFYQNIKYIFMDTCGFKKKKKQNFLEYVSRIKTFSILNKCDIILLLFDAKIGITSQDLFLLNLIVKKGYICLIFINKWDFIPKNQKNIYKKNILDRLKFVSYYKIFFISALKKIGLNSFFNNIQKIYNYSKKKFTPLFLTNILQKAILKHPVHMGTLNKRIRLKYAHLGGINPLTIIIHGTQTNFLKLSYQKYLKNFFQKKLLIFHSSIQIFFKNSFNPFFKKKK
ncbi:ribosome biogenesis GTPase Der [Buchnera aphidicola]|uniref:ribosome biogenesis GTPase Der n=1 Tax=Buchnera aphidicola TaxID=9 RepID=UPI0031B6E51F